MDKVLAVIISATAILIAGMMVLAVLDTNISGLGSDLEDTSERGCEFQRENADSPEELSEECRTEESTDETSLGKEYHGINSGELSV